MGIWDEVVAECPLHRSEADHASLAVGHIMPPRSGALACVRSFKETYQDLIDKNWRLSKAQAKALVLAAGHVMDETSGTPDRILAAKGTLDALCDAEGLPRVTDDAAPTLPDPTSPRMSFDAAMKAHMRAVHEMTVDDAKKATEVPKGRSKKR